MNFKLIYLLISILFVINSNTISQNKSIDSLFQTDYTVIMAPNPDFEAGSLHKKFFGSHWRDLWITPAEFPVMKWKDYKITEEVSGSGKQTLSFEFEDESGTEYKFRSIRKYSKSVDPELKESIAGDVIEDQLSSKHPTSPIISYNLIKSVGLLMPEPKVFIMSNNIPMDTFKGMLGTLQEQPRDGYMGFEDVIKTEDLLEEQNKDSYNVVNAEEFLKSRLMDIVMGDWDRHEGQWRWGLDSSLGSFKIWNPISMDRDEAFARYDGLFPWIYALSIPRYESFSDDYPQVDDLTWEGRYLDRKFLTSLTKKQWDSITNVIKADLTNDEIRASVKTMPPSWYSLKGFFMEDALIKRRNDLSKMADDYYTLIFKQPDIWASDQAEKAYIEYIDDNRVRVSLYNINADSIGVDQPFFSRIFDEEVTKEVRIYMQGGDDEIIMRGPSSDDITLRLIGGSGNDRITDETWDEDADVVFYDSGRNTSIKSRNVIWEDESYKMPKDVIDRINPDPQDWDIDWKFKPWLGYSSDDGVILGGGPVFQKFGFRYKPFKYRLQLMGAYATKANAYHIKLESQFYNVFRNINTKVNLFTSTLVYTNFYGMGNNTAYDELAYDNNYYRVEQNFNKVELLLTKNVFKDFYGTAGLTFSYINTRNKAGTIVDSLQPFGLGKFNYYGLTAELLYEAEDLDIKHINGTYVRLAADYYPDIFKKDVNYTKLHLNVRKVFLQNFMKKSYFIVTAYGEKVFGDYPFFDAAHLGGRSNLRGYNRDRFSGDAAVSGGLEFNMFVFSPKLIFTSDMGLTIFSDVGRVFLDGEESNTIYYGYGGGIWLSYFRNIMAIQLTAANTKEGMKYYLDTSFGF